MFCNYVAVLGPSRRCEVMARWAVIKKKNKHGASWGEKRGGGIQLYGDSSYATFFLGSLLIQRGKIMECQASGFFSTLLRWLLGVIQLQVEIAVRQAADFLSRLESWMSNFPSKSNNPGWKRMIWDLLHVILLMEEILHHLGCRKPCKQWEKLSISGHKLSSINSIINFTLGRFNISSKAFVRFVPVQKPLQRSIDRVRWSFGAHRCTVQFTTFAMCNGSLPTPGLSQLSRRMELLLHGVTGGGHNTKTRVWAKDGLWSNSFKHL